MEESEVDQRKSKYTGARFGGEIGPYDISVFHLNARIKSKFTKTFCSRYEEEYDNDGVEILLSELEDAKKHLESEDGFDYVKEVKRCANFDDWESFAKERKEQLLLYLESVVNEVQNNGRSLEYVFYMATNFYFFAKRGEDVKVTWLPDKEILLSQSILETEITVYPTLTREILKNGNRSNIVLQKTNEWNTANYREDLKDAQIGQTQRITDRNSDPYIDHDIFFDDEKEESRLSDLVHFNRGVFQTPVRCEEEVVGFLFVCSPIDFESLFENDEACEEFFVDIKDEVVEEGPNKTCAIIKDRYERSVSLVEGYHKSYKINSAIEVFEKIIVESEKDSDQNDLHNFLGSDNAREIISGWLNINKEEINKESAQSLFLYDDEPWKEKYKTPKDKKMRVYILKSLLRKVGLDDVEIQLNSEDKLHVPTTPFITFFLSLKNFIYALNEDGPPPKNLALYRANFDRNDPRSKVFTYHLEMELHDSEENTVWGLPYTFNKEHQRTQVTAKYEDTEVNESNVSRSLNNLLYCALGKDYFNPRQDPGGHIKLLHDGFSRQVVNVSFPALSTLIISWMVSDRNC